MQILIDIDEEDYKIMQHNVAIDNPLCPLDEREMVTKVANGIPLDSVKFHIEHMACKQYEYRLTLDRQEVIDILDNIGKGDDNGKET